MLKSIAILWALFLPLIGPGACYAQGYPSEPMYEGTIFQLDLAGQGMGIGDRLFRYGRMTRVFGPEGRKASFSDLENGQRVACNFVIDDQGGLVLTHVWIFPAGSGSAE